MFKKMVISRAEREDAVEQLEIRIKKMRSHSNILLARKLFETVEMKKGFTADELAKYLGESPTMLHKRISNFCPMHGIKIANKARKHDESEYKLVAFTLPVKRKRYEKKVPKANVVMEHPLTYNSLINEVFC